MRICLTFSPTPSGNIQRLPCFCSPPVEGTANADWKLWPLHIMLRERAHDSFSLGVFIFCSRSSGWERLPWKSKSKWNLKLVPILVKERQNKSHVCCVTLLRYYSWHLMVLGEASMLLPRWSREICLCQTGITREFQPRLNKKCLHRKSRTREQIENVVTFYRLEKKKKKEAKGTAAWIAAWLKPQLLLLSVSIFVLRRLKKPCWTHNVDG